jgi:predicted kinase
VVGELVVMVGLQGCGKSTWVRRHLWLTHLVVSKDHWPNARRRERRQQRRVAEALAAGRLVVVDNTNPSRAERAPLIALAHEHGATARAVFVDVPIEECLRRNAARTGRAVVPLVGVYDAARRLVPPSPAEGFDMVDRVDTIGQST